MNLFNQKMRLSFSLSILPILVACQSGGGATSVSVIPADSISTESTPHPTPSVTPILNSTPSALPTITPTVSPLPTVSPTATPTATPSATPTPTPNSTWVGTNGNLNDGTWNDPIIAPDASHHGAYGGMNYAPNGDLYLFYQTGVYPNENLQGVIRRNGSNNWSNESFLGSRARTAHTYFDENGKPSVASESGGSVEIYTSSDYNIANVSWTDEVHFQANDGNVDGYGVNANAFLTFGTNGFNLFYTYLYGNAVVGGETWGVQSVLQSNGIWQADGTQGNHIDGNQHPIYETLPHGASGAFQDQSGNLLVLSNLALRSTDGGATFTQVMNSGIVQNDLTHVSSATQNPTDQSILVANLYSIGSDWNLKLWGTRDYGSTFSSLVTVPHLNSPSEVEMASIQNLVVVAITIAGVNGPSSLFTMTSQDGGVTFSSLTNLIDATQGGANPTYTLGNISLSANSITGSVALSYSLLNGSAHKGVYLKEFH